LFCCFFSINPDSYRDRCYAPYPFLPSNKVSLLHRISPEKPYPISSTLVQLTAPMILETLFRAITWFPSPSCGRGFSHRDAFGKTHEWVASPEEQTDGNPLKQCPDPVAS